MTNRSRIPDIARRAMEMDRAELRRRRYRLERGGEMLDRATAILILLNEIIRATRDLCYPSISVSFLLISGACFWCHVDCRRESEDPLLAVRGGPRMEGFPSAPPAYPNRQPPSATRPVAVPGAKRVK
jgi:hypothetical protein